MSIYFTGDIHGHIDISKLNKKNFKDSERLTKNDFLIILGDFGLIWCGEKKDSWWLDWLNNQPFTTLFIDGNHENFNLLYEFPQEKWKGGLVHRIRDSIFHLQRGEVYEIDGKRFFTFGGASSIDKMHRIPNSSWWEQEIPTKEEIQYGVDNLDKYDHFDYILTHSGPLKYIQEQYAYMNGVQEEQELQSFFRYIDKFVNYDHWYFGHFHLDEDFSDKIHCLYDKIIKIE